ncbi:Phosphatidylinositol 4-kinase gamma 4 [Striga hermonthica]|uniref:1-phosphatidylinositol 4-kinase n=1 Tax=Striga hermonthica TaxID=68872 RepID=A0A9N7NXB2_STRHE|nr:Phosphatidylinositol 4-kinase gamma 4 [Striga hermonthica]
MSAVDVALSPIPKGTAKSAVSFDHSRRFKSILIYITFGGSSIPMRVMESDSIASVKLRIQTCKGFVVKRQKLVFAGWELSRTDSNVKDYGISNGNVVHLALRISDILLISVRTPCGKELFELRVDRHRNVGYLKRRIAKKGKKGRIFCLEDPPDIFFRGEKLEEDYRLIHDITDSSDPIIHLFVVQKPAKIRTRPIEKEIKISVVAPDFKKTLEPIFAGPQVDLPPFLQEMIWRISEGLASGKQPIRSSEGTGGTYFMPDSCGEKYSAVFKPVDEEPLAKNNPQGLPISMNGEGLKKGTRVGQGAFREVAAYLLDHPRSGPRSKSCDLEKIGFAGLQPTVMVGCLHGGFNHPDGFEWSDECVKVGSLQVFVKNEGSCDDVGPRDFPVAEVHKIGVFDMRTANADRHAGNILICRDEEETGRIVLVPIDHGYCLPENFEDCTFDWLYWPQAREPFSQETLDYIKSLDAEQDISLLNSYGLKLSPESTRTLRISTMLLKKGAVRGLTPFQIGSIMCRENLNKKSVLEEIVGEANDSLLPQMSDSAFFEALSETMDSTLDKLMCVYV